MSLVEYGTDLIKTLTSTALGDSYTIPNSCEPTIPFINESISIIKCPNNGEYTTSTDTAGSNCTTSLDWGFEGDASISVGADAHFYIPTSVYGSTTGSFDMKEGVPNNVYLGQDQTSGSSTYLDMNTTPSVDASVKSDKISFSTSLDFDDGVQMPFPGYPAVCTRTAYNAPAAACCMSNGSTNSFFESSGLSGTVQLQSDSTDPETSLVTCDPSFSYISSSCDNPVASFCSTDENYGNLGDIMDNTDFKQWKTGGSCNDYADDGTSSSTGKHLALEQSLIALNKKHPIGKLGSNKNAIDAWTGILDSCNKNLGTCDATLSMICSSETRDELVAASQNPDDPANAALMAACACHLPASQYSEYAGIMDEGSYNQCDPICMAPGAIPKGDSRGQPVVCKQTACVIDDATIDIINSNTGDVTINQVCGNGVGNGGGSCYFTDNTVFTKGSDTGKISFDQDCGSCFIYQNNDPYNPIPVACDGSGTAGPTPVGWKTIEGDIGVQVESAFGSLLSWIKNSPVIALPVIGIILLVVIIIIVIIVLNI